MLVYAVTNTVTGKQYIGQTVRTLAERKRNHLKAFKSGKRHPLYAAFKAYGLEVFNWQIIHQADSVDQLNNLEIAVIDKNKTLHPTGYNLATGGKNGTYSEATKQLMSEIHTGVPLTDSHRAAIRDGMIGNTNTLGLKHTDETKAKMSAASSGSRNPMFGRKHSPETLEKIRKAARKPRKKKNNG